MKRLCGFCLCLIFFGGLGLSFVSAKGVSYTSKKKEVVLPKNGKKRPTKAIKKATPSALGKKAPYPRTAFLKLQKYGKIIAPDGSEMKIIREEELKKFRDIP
jgi:hypothetical protein